MSKFDEAVDGALGQIDERKGRLRTVHDGGELFISRDDLVGQLDGLVSGKSAEARDLLIGLIKILVDLK